MKGKDQSGMIISSAQYLVVNWMCCDYFLLRAWELLPGPSGATVFFEHFEFWWHPWQSEAKNHAFKAAQKLRRFLWLWRRLEHCLYARRRGRTSLGLHFSRSRRQTLQGIESQPRPYLHLERRSSRLVKHQSSLVNNWSYWAENYFERSKKRGLQVKYICTRVYVIFKSLFEIIINAFTTPLCFSRT